MSMEGYLEKERAGSLIPMREKVYVKIAPDYSAIIFASSLEAMARGEIEGKILMRSILDITQADENDKKFDIVVKGLVSSFLAKTAEECTNWVETIHKVHTEIKRSDRRLLKELLALHPDAKLELTLEGDDTQDEDEFFLMQPVNVVKSAIQTVIVKGTINPTVNLVKAGMKGLVSLFTNEKPKTNVEYLLEKFGPAVGKIHPRNFQTHFKMGMLLRETKEAVGVDSVDNLINDTGIREVVQTRWCLLVSQKPVCRSQVKQENEATLSQEVLSIPLEFDSLYLYGESCDSSGPIEVIPMKDVVHVNIKKLAQENEEYLFTFDLGHRRYNLICSSFTEMITWFEAIQTSRATAFEAKRSKDPILKNLFWLMRIQDDEDGDGDAKLAQRIREDYEKLSEMQIIGLKSFLLVQQKVAQEFLGIINACLACQVSRIDIIKMYTKVYHENILNSFKNFYKERSQDLDIESLLEIIRFFDWYQNSLLVHGTSFADPRIKEVLDVLSTAATTYILKKINFEAIKNIHEQFLNNPLVADSKGRIESQSPEHISRILRDTVNFASYYNTKDFILQLLEVCKTTLQNYQETIAKDIQGKDLTNERLVAICNDVIRCKTEIKEFDQVIEKLLSSSNSEDLSLPLNSQFVNESLALLEEKSMKKLAKNLLSWDDMANSEGFVDLDFPSIIQNTIQKSEETLNKMYPSSITQLNLQILKEAVENYTKIPFEVAEANLEAVIEHLKKFKGLEESDLEKVLQQITDFCRNKNEEVEQQGGKNQKTLNFVPRENLVAHGRKIYSFSSLRFKLDGILKMESNFVKDVLVGNISSQRYFSLRNDKLFCFEHKKAETASTMFNLRETIECYAEGTNSFVLMMLDANVMKNSPHLRNQKPLKEAILKVVENIKDHQGIIEWKFYAEKPERRDLWVEVINSVLNKMYEDKSNETQINDPSVPIYEDTTSLFAN